MELYSTSKRYVYTWQLNNVKYVLTKPKKILPKNWSNIKHRNKNIELTQTIEDMSVFRLVFRGKATRVVTCAATEQNSPSKSPSHHTHHTLQQLHSQRHAISCWRWRECNSICASLVASHPPLASEANTARCSVSLRRRRRFLSVSAHRARDVTWSSLTSRVSLTAAANLLISVTTDLGNSFQKLLKLKWQYFTSVLSVWITERYSLMQVSTFSHYVTLLFLRLSERLLEKFS